MLGPLKLAEKSWEVITNEGETVLPNVFYADRSQNELISGSPRRARLHRHDPTNRSSSCTTGDRMSLRRRMTGMAVFGSRVRALVVSLPVIAFAVGCENIIGTFEVAPPDAGIAAVEAGTPDAPVGQDVQDGGQGDSGPAAKVRACNQLSDCPTLPTTPVGCAVAECKDNVCVYVAVDKDGDGHPVAGCKVEDKLVPGDDCADNDPTVFPGGKCNKRPDGSDIVFPNGTPLGACRAGAWDCTGAARAARARSSPSRRRTARSRTTPTATASPTTAATARRTTSGRAATRRTSRCPA